MFDHTAVSFATFPWSEPGRLSVAEGRSKSRIFSESKIALSGLLLDTSSFSQSAESPSFKFISLCDRPIVAGATYGVSHIKVSIRRSGSNSAQDADRS